MIHAMHWLIELLVVTLLLVYSLHLYVSRNFDYWKKRNVPFLRPRPFVGSMMGMVTQKYEIGRFFGNLYEKIDAPFFGFFIFSKPALIVKDVELMKHIMITDFDHFVDRNVYAPDHDPAVAHMLFIEKGHTWRKMRAKMSPFFSPYRTKSMFGVMDKLATSLSEYIATNKENPNFDVKDVSNKYSVDLIAKCVFGVESKSLEIEDAVFMKIANKVFDTRRITCFRYLCYFYFQTFARIFKLRLFSAEVLNFYRSVLWECIETREKGNVKGNDLVDIIVNLRKDKEFCEHFKFEGDAVIAQALIFFVAGFETTATTIALTLYSLCLHQDIQRKLRQDIKDVLKKHENQLTVESIQEISYLDMVIKESLRKYSPAPIIDRVCTADYNIPGTDIVIDKGTIVIIPSVGVQEDPKFFAKPEEYIPERFELLKEDISYLAFGHGPRQCIGRRFALISVKLAIVRVLQKFEVHSTDETPVPVVFSPRSFVPQSSKKLAMRFVKVDTLF